MIDRHDALAPDHVRNAIPSEGIKPPHAGLSTNEEGGSGCAESLFHRSVPDDVADRTDHRRRCPGR